jgi:hypothetical protein
MNSPSCARPTADHPPLCDACEAKLESICGAAKRQTSRAPSGEGMAEIGAICAMNHSSSWLRSA